LYRGIILGISGLLALFLTILFVVKGTVMFPATAALAWSVLAYLCIDFGFWGMVFKLEGGSSQLARASAEVMLAASLIIFLYAYLNLNRWNIHYSHLALTTLILLFGAAWCCGLGSVNCSRYCPAVFGHHRYPRVRHNRRVGVSTL
jgi:hypothetical protein